MRLRRTSVHSVFVLFTLLSLILAACGGGTAATPVQATAAPAAAQPTVAPTAAAAGVVTKAAEAVATKAPEPTAAPEPTQAPTATEAPAAPVEAAPAGGDALDLLLNAMRAQLAQGAWRTTATIDDAGKTTTTMVEFVAPGSMHMSTGAGQEFIVVKEGTYQKDAAGTWQKLDFDMSSVLAGILDPKSVEELMAGVTVDKLKFLGPDIIGGKPMWMYQYASQMKVGEQTISSTVKVWIGVLDKLPYKGESEGDSILNPGSKTKTTTVYEYGSGIKIEAPIK